MELVKEFGEVVGEADTTGKKKVVGKEWIRESVTEGRLAKEEEHIVR